ncbi:MAG: PQQ-binding-like beta-propeller repeat protein [Planctomycetaceae bacterium]|nr:PQQ-binding-like beta-propeller repeat protein [Planctomycetaceae bacterium]
MARLAQLRELYLWRTRVSDDGLQKLKSLQRLQVLNLWDTAATDRTLKQLLPQLPALQHVYLGSSPNPLTVFYSGDWELPVSTVSSAAIARLRSECPGLEVVFWQGEDNAAAPADGQSASAATVASVFAAAGDDVARRPAATDWPGFLGPAGDGHSSESLPQRDWQQHPPRLLWKRRTGEGYSAPSVAGDRLIYTDRQKNVERIVCVSAPTGQTIWQQHVRASYQDALGYGDGPRATPLIDGQRVYSVTADGILDCRQLHSGELLWRRNLSSDFAVTGNLYGVGASPFVYGNLLLLVVGGRERNAVPAAAGVVAFDKHTGHTVYSTGDVQASYASVRVIDAHDPPLGVAFAREGLLVFDALTGRQRHQIPWAAKVSGCVNAVTPVISGSEVFVSEAYGPGSILLRFEDENFDVVWADQKRSRRRVLRAHWATPLLYDGHLYACSGRHSAQGELRCINWETGFVEWRHQQRCLSSLCGIDGCLINVTEYGQVELIVASAESFQLLSRFTPGPDGQPARPDGERLLKFPVWAAPVVSNGRLFLRSSDSLVGFQIR